ncbi:succinylglutamate desuccinylase/aspartoacylase family protein [Alsobacter sp. KACC 23698]|uniref:Succinylglutamate desuccinylase/aspartoacylase family protein n=1 Tax=Alsobacter sp. KACC 23698 TaxID=3149229 RepID=A0AAU7JN09_9HYPH
MLADFDLARPGKTFHDLGPITGPLDGVAGDVLCSINNGQGPSVLLFGGVHGDEYEAQIALRRLAERIRPEDVTGRILIAPSINFPASETGKRLSPFDGQNMNRVFPGNPQGTPTEKLAAFATGSLFPAVDLLIDVHAGGRDVSVVPMVFGFTTPASKVDETALTDLMEAWGYRFVQHVKGIRETACGAAEAADLASIEVEGGGGRMKSSELRIMEEGLMRALSAYGVLKPALEPARFRGVHVTAGPEGQYVAARAGLVEHLVGLGDEVDAQTVVALLHPTAGADPKPEAIRSPMPGYVLRQTEHVHVTRGQLIGNVGTPRTASA